MGVLQWKRLFYLLEDAGFTPTRCDWALDYYGDGGLFEALISKIPKGEYTSYMRSIAVRNHYEKDSEEVGSWICVGDPKGESSARIYCRLDRFSNPMMRMEWQTRKRRAKESVGLFTEVGKERIIGLMKNLVMFREPGPKTNRSMSKPFARFEAIFANATRATMSGSNIKAPTPLSRKAAWLMGKVAATLYELSTHEEYGQCFIEELMQHGKNQLQRRQRAKRR